MSKQHGLGRPRGHTNIVLLVFVFDDTLILAPKSKFFCLSLSDKSTVDVVGYIYVDYTLLGQFVVVYDCAPSLSPELRSLYGRPGCSGSIDLPTSCPSLSLPSPMMRRTHTIMAMLARLARVRH